MAPFTPSVPVMATALPACVPPTQESAPLQVPPTECHPELHGAHVPDQHDEETENRIAPVTEHAMAPAVEHPVSAEHPISPAAEHTHEAPDNRNDVVDYDISVDSPGHVDVEAGTAYDPPTPDSGCAAFPAATAVASPDAAQDVQVDASASGTPQPSVDVDTTTSPISNEKVRISLKLELIHLARLELNCNACIVLFARLAGYGSCSAVSVLVCLCCNLKAGAPCFTGVRHWWRRVVPGVCLRIIGCCVSFCRVYLETHHSIKWRPFLCIWLFVWSASASFPSLDAKTSSCLYQAASMKTLFRPIASKSPTDNIVLRVGLAVQSSISAGNVMHASAFLKVTLLF